jgi:hypothetical protein
MTTSKRFNRTRINEAYEDSKLLQIVAWLLFIGLLVALITISIINIKPYTIIISSVSSNAKWVFDLPLIGAVLKAVSGGFDLITAILIWAPIQILQCLWLLIKIDATAQKNALRQSAALENSIPEEQRKGRYSRQHARRVSGIPFFFIKWAAGLALAAYAFDLIVGLQTYPVWASWEAFGFWAKSLNPIWINSNNLRDLLVMLFSFEAVLVPFLVVKQWVKMNKGEDYHA